MTRPDVAKVDEYMKLAAEVLNYARSNPSDRTALTDLGRTWLEAARFQHQRVLDHADLARKETDDA